MERVETQEVIEVKGVAIEVQTASEAWDSIHQSLHALKWAPVWSGVVELPALVTLRVSNEDTLYHVRSKAPKWSLVLLNQDIGSTAPNTQMREIGLVPTECFMWSCSLKRCGSHPIAHMDALRYLQGTMDYRITYQPSDSPEPFIAYSDADHGYRRKWLHPRRREASQTHGA